jgi:hypothetical protein
MFVLMVAVVPHLLSDQPPEVPRRAGLGDRFHYFRGATGRRYLFSAVPEADLASFRSAVVVFAAPSAKGRLMATWATVLDRFGRPHGIGGRCEAEWPPAVSPGPIVLIHLLSRSEAERFSILADIAGGMTLSLPLAA